MSFGSVEQANSWAPIASASSFFAGEVEKAVVSQPSARSIRSAMCPRPPIPITATLLVASTPKRRIGAKTVTPPQRSGGHGAVHRLGQRKHEPTVEADPVGDAAVMPHAGRLLLSTEVLFAAEAEIALEAGAPLPADADALADGEVTDRRACRGDGPGDLVARHLRILAAPPAVVDQVDVAVAEAAVRDFDLDIVRPQLLRLVFKRLERSPLD